MANTGSKGLPKRVAIVGGGPLGLIATKNLVEEGFEVTTFERSDDVGGLWRAPSDPTRTCILPGTITNTSKFTGTMTDFPMPESYPIYPRGHQIHAYFRDYADHFGLRKHIRLGTEVLGVTRNDADTAWELTVRTGDDKTTLTFERLILATGMFTKASMPTVPGMEKFDGQVMHSQAFKDPAQLQDKRVLVVGLGSTAADIISGLFGVGVKRLIVSHRQKPLILPRITKDHKVLEFTLTFRLLQLIFRLQEMAPSLMASIFASELKKIEKANFPDLIKHRAYANDRKLPGPKHLMPVVSDDLAGHFLSGRLESAPGIQEITGPSSVRFVDGTEVHDIDAILFCTGMQPDVAAYMPPAFDPYNAALAPAVFGRLPRHYADERRVARLYQGFLSLQSPHSLAFLGVCFGKRPAFQLYDLMTMALAQLWSDGYPMPTPAAMAREADAHFSRLAKLDRYGDVKITGILGHLGFDQWLNEVAGTGLYEHLGNWTNSASWKLWWNDRKLYKALVSGILSTHALRLFETPRGRKAWPGARDAILAANAEVFRFEHGKTVE